MKTVILAIMLFVFSSLGASTKILNNEFSASYNSSNIEIKDDFKKLEFTIGFADSLKALDSKYQKSSNLMSRVIVMFNYRF